MPPSSEDYQHGVESPYAQPLQQDVGNDQVNLPESFLTPASAAHNHHTLLSAVLGAAAANLVAESPQPQHHFPQTSLSMQQQQAPSAPAAQASHVYHHALPDPPMMAQLPHAFPATVPAGPVDMTAFAAAPPHGQDQLFAPSVPMNLQPNLPTSVPEVQQPAIPSLPVVSPVPTSSTQQDRRPISPASPNKKRKIEDYALEFKIQIIDLHHVGASPAQLAKSHDVPISTIRGWITDEAYLRSVLKVKERLAAEGQSSPVKTNLVMARPSNEPQQIPSQQIPNDGHHTPAQQPNLELKREQRALATGVRNQEIATASLAALIASFSVQLELPKEVMIITAEVVTRAQLMHNPLLVAVPPPVLVAACIFFVSRLHMEKDWKTPADLARLSGCPEGDIQYVYAVLHSVRTEMCKGVNTVRDWTALPDPVAQPAPGVPAAAAEFLPLPQQSLQQQLQQIGGYQPGIDLPGMTPAPHPFTFQASQPIVHHQTVQPATPSHPL
ncbi:hypothetical protein HKX48_000212, partial [Thoreauomyces humboldtii]